MHLPKPVATSIYTLPLVVAMISSFFGLPLLPAMTLSGDIHADGRLIRSRPYKAGLIHHLRDEFITRFVHAPGVCGDEVKAEREDKRNRKIELIEADDVFTALDSAVDTARCDVDALGKYRDCFRAFLRSEGMTDVQGYQGIGGGNGSGISVSDVGAAVVEEKEGDNNLYINRECHPDNAELEESQSESDDEGGGSNGSGIGLDRCR